MTEWPLSPSETLYSFAGWLAAQDQEITIGGGRDPGALADLVQQWCEASGLPNPRSGWEALLATTPAVTPVVTPNPDEYQPVPVYSAASIAARFAKSIVIVAAHDAKAGVLHVTTYGNNPQEKAWAADGGEIVAKALGTMPDQATFHENYRQHCCVASGHVQWTPTRIRCVAHPQPTPENGASS